MQRWIGAVWLVAMCTACGPHKPAPPSAQFVAWSQQGASPRWLCVLPFTNETGQPEVGRQVRRSFAGHLSIKRFRDVELYEIDTRAFSVISDASEEAGGTPDLPASPPAPYPAAFAPPPMTHNRMKLL